MGEDRGKERERLGWPARGFIAAFLLVQLVLPLRYYLGDDRFDERFSWRMFSSQWRQQKLCEVEYAEHVRDAPGAPRDARADAVTDTVWGPILRRGWPRVVTDFLAHRCERDPLVVAVDFERRCKAAPGEPRLQTAVRYDCATGALDGGLGAAMTRATALARFDRWFAEPVCAARPWLLQRALLALVAIDCVTLLPRAWRYGAGEFNAAHARILDTLLPPPTPELYAGCLLVAGAAAAASALRPTRTGIGIAALAWTAAWSMSLLDSFQHHYLLSWILLLLACFPRVGLSSAARGRAPAWAFVLLATTLGLVYAWTAVAKLDAPWRSGEMLWFLAYPPIGELFGIARPAEALSAWTARLGIDPRVLLSAAAWGVVVAELALAAGYVAARALGQGARIALLLVAVAFHAAIEFLLLLQIGWFSYYMALCAFCVLAPGAWVRAVPAALARSRDRVRAALAKVRRTEEADAVV